MVFSGGALRTAVCTAVVTISAYSASVAVFEGRARATASPSVDAVTVCALDASADLTVPAATRPGSPVPRANESSLPITVPLLLVILAAGGIAVALIAGRKRAASLDAASPGSAGAGPALSGGPPPGDQVRVVPHFGSGPRVTVREAHRSLTNVVRLEPHSGVPMVEVEERR